MVHRTEANSIDCSSFEERIHQLLDDRLTLTGDQLLMDHAEQCADCSSLLLDYDSVEDSVSLFRSDIEAAINERLAQQDQEQKSNFRLGWFVAIAASLFLFVGMFQSETRHRDKVASRAPISKVAVAPRLGVAGLGKKADAPTPKVSPKKPTPSTSPFSPDFSLADHFPRLPILPSFEQIASSFEPVWNYSAEIPGVRPAQCSISFAIDLIKQSFYKQESNDDTDLGLIRFYYVCA